MEKLSRIFQDVVLTYSNMHTINSNPYKRGRNTQDGVLMMFPSILSRCPTYLSLQGLLYINFVGASDQFLPKLLHHRRAPEFCCHRCWRRSCHAANDI